LVAVFAVPVQEKKTKKSDDFVIVITNALSDDPIIDPTNSSALPVTPNPINETYPILPVPQSMTGDTYAVAAAPVIDYAKKNLDGIEQKPIVFAANANSTNPMEKKTPLVDIQPCYPDRVLNVEVLSASLGIDKYPVLPSKYGCSTGKDNSREKASPSIRWTGYNMSELTDFSLQMISMGDEKCTGFGTPGFNTIHWHIIEMKPTSTVFTLEEGASNDPRLLFGGHELPNQWLEDYYGGPCPPPGVTECFRFKVLAHLNDGRQCFCGFEDVLFKRPEKIVVPPGFNYTQDVISKNSKKI